MVFFVFNFENILNQGGATQLAGNAPFIIDKDTGEVHDLGTAYPIEKYL